MIKYLVYFQLITNIQICGGQYPPKQNCLIILLAAPAATAACQVTLFFLNSPASDAAGRVGYLQHPALPNTLKVKKHIKVPISILYPCAI